MFSDISVGAVGAALIGAALSLVSLIIAKEAKISDFRQAWIDALREALTKYLANVNTLIDANHLTFKDKKQRFKDLQPFIEALNQSYYEVALRINSREKLAFDVKRDMIKLGSLAKSEQISLEDFERARVEFLNSSASLLKFEWKRVKTGEPVYRITRYLAASAVLSLVLYGGLVAVQPNATTKDGPATVAPKQVEPIKPGPNHVSHAPPKKD